MQRPEKSEYAPYYHQYIEQVPRGDILDYLEQQRNIFSARLAEIPEERGGHRYAAGKWSVKEVVGHVIDIERVFLYRALSFARADAGPIPGVEQDDWVAAAGFDARTLQSLREEFHHLRSSGIVLLCSFDEATSLRRGIASGCEFTVRAIPYVLAGHLDHHARVLEEPAVEEQFPIEEEPELAADETPQLEGGMPMEEQGEPDLEVEIPGEEAPPDMEEPGVELPEGAENPP